MINALFRAAVLTVVVAPLSWATDLKGRQRHVEMFEPPGGAEVIATVVASCGGCDWSAFGREAAALRLEIDGAYSQHVLLTRGAAEAEYQVLLGSFQNGRHSLSLSVDNAASAKSTRTASVSKVSFRYVTPTQPDYTATSLAPILYARPNTIGKFTDTPLLMWYEVDKTERGSRIRYSVIFSNEDGGTPPDRLLATWGRLTDIEYVYGIEIDAAGKVLEETFQGKDHEILAFRGKREGRHPLLYVITNNNMVKDEGTSGQRHAPAPIAFDLQSVSREAVMDQNPWTYAVTAAEARREGRVTASPAPGSKQIFDPSRYAVVEACTAPEDAGFAMFTFSLDVMTSKGVRAFDSTGGVPEYRINRSPSEFPNGCFRGAVALPAGTKPADILSLRFLAEKRRPRKGDPPITATGPAHLRHVNRLFVMDEHDQPGPNLFTWSGGLPIELNGAGAVVELKK